MIGPRRQLGVVKAKMGDAAGAGVERDALKAKLAECGDACAANAELKAAVDAIDAAIAAGPQASVSSHAAQPRSPAPRTATAPIWRRCR